MTFYMIHRSAHLQLVATAAYYLGWIAAILAVLMRVIKVDSFLGISPRTFLEGGLLMFAICIASGILVLALSVDNHDAKAKQTD